MNNMTSEFYEINEEAYAERQAMLAELAQEADEFVMPSFDDIVAIAY